MSSSPWDLWETEDTRYLRWASPLELDFLTSLAHAALVSRRHGLRIIQFLGCSGIQVDVIQFHALQHYEASCGWLLHYIGEFSHPKQFRSRMYLACQFAELDLLYAEFGIFLSSLLMLGPRGVSDGFYLILSLFIGHIFPNLLFLWVPCLDPRKSLF